MQEVNFFLVLLHAPANIIFFLSAFFLFLFFDIFKFSLIKSWITREPFMRGHKGHSQSRPTWKKPKFCLASGKFGTIYNAFFLIIKETANAAEPCVCVDHREPLEFS